MFLVVANWKMNGNAKLAEQFNASLKTNPKAEAVICPPFHLINSIKGKRGAQNCHHSHDGAHTGEISVHMLKELGAKYVILGHSERREAGETSAQVARKAEAALKAGLKVILCIGEKEGEDIDVVVAEQLKASLPGSKDNITIAYEPVWAIGSGRTPSHKEIEEAHALINRLSGLKVIYGGSVKAENAGEISRIKGVNGLLVGGASLDINSFNAIITAI